MDVLSKIVSFILVAILIFLLPLQYIFGHQLLLFDDYIEDEAANLVDDMREKSYLDVKMYEGFLEKLNIIGVLYDVGIEHAVPKSGKEMSYIDELPGVLVASSELHRLPMFMLSSEDEIYSLAAHMHTDDCYPLCYGIDHNVDGSINDDDCIITYDWAASYGVTHYECRACGAEILKVVGTPGGTYPTRYAHKVNRTTPRCSEVVMSAIVATNPTQTVNVGGSIITTATASFLDGHTGTVNCTSNFNPGIVGV